MRFMKRYFLGTIFCVIHLIAMSQSSWEIEAKDINPDHYYGISCANGVIGLVSSPHPMEVQDVVLNGVYDYYQRGRVSNILKTFNHVNMYLDVDGVRITADNVEGYAQTLDMQKAILKTSFRVGEKAMVTHQLMALRHLPYTAMSMIEIEAKTDIRITPYSVIVAPNHLKDVRQFYNEVDRPHVSIPLLTSVAESPSGMHKLATSNSFIFEESHGEEPQIVHEDWDYDRHWAKFSKTLKAGETYRFAVVGTTLSSVQYNDPHNEAERLTIYAKLEGVEKLLERHLAAWATLWESDIIIEGDERSQRDVRSMLYHLYSFARAGTAYSLSPMGLSGLGYNGHVFWDTEIWMYPPILALQPKIAESLMEYRYQRLDAAKQNAFAHGYEGAMYPWESSADGSEDTPFWALTGPFQQHITGDVAWATWKYYQATGDKNWLATKGDPILEASADFWASRVTRVGPGRFEIQNVVGADEYAENIDNDAYTNGVAKVVLQYANLAAEALGLKPNPDWKLVAENIPIERFPDGTIREHSTYKGEQIKQADVNLLYYPIEALGEQEKSEVYKNLRYYEARLDEKGPAMAHAAYGTIYARLQDAEKAFDLFQRSYQPNAVPPFGVLAETAGGTNPYFATGAGGALQLVLFGFGGLEITDKGITQQKSVLPKQWKKLIIKGVGPDKKTFTVTQ